MKFQEKRKITVVHCLVSISASVLVLFCFFFCLLFLQSFSFLRDFGGDISITSLKVTLKSSVKYRHTIKHFFLQSMLLSHKFVVLRIGGWKDQQNSWKPQGTCLNKPWLGEEKPEGRIAMGTLDNQLARWAMACWQPLWTCMGKILTGGWGAGLRNTTSLHQLKMSSFKMATKNIFKKGIQLGRDGENKCVSRL